MAQSVVLTDDTDGTPAAETLTFTVDGVTYDVDLSEANAAAFRAAIAPYAQAGRPTASKAPGGRTPRPRSSSGSRARTAGGLTPEEAAAIRAWARDNGHEVSDRGRLGKHLIDGYRAAQAG